MSNHFPAKTMWRSFFCALVGTVTLQTMNPYRTGKLVMFQVSYDRDWHFFEMIFFVLLGVFGVCICYPTPILYKFQSYDQLDSMFVFSFNFFRDFTEL